jgi:hypothetical protein
MHFGCPDTNVMRRPDWRVSRSAQAWKRGIFEAADGPRKQGLIQMDNDKAFASYALGLILLTAFVATGAMVATGLGLIYHPAALVIEHLALGITFRAAYKSLDGSNWILDILHSTGMITPQEEAAPAIGGQIANAA